MTDKQTIEKLNDGLMQLIDAYEKLQEKNEVLEEELAQEKAKNADLEYKLSDFNTTTEAQTTKMDGMLSKIQKLLKPNEKIEVEEKSVDTNNSFDVQDNDSILDIKLDTNEPEIEQKKEETKTKIDLGRMETLLNGLNNR